jgi:hypothetical protein
VPKPAAAVNEFKGALQQALSCVTRDVLVVNAGGYAPSAVDREPHMLTFARDPVLLGGPAQLVLSANHRYRVLRPGSAGPWRVQTAAYYYRFEDILGRELLALHWHPETVPDVPYPHLHIGRGVVAMESLIAAGLSAQHNALRPEIAGAHIPTSRIALEHVLELAIRHFSVPPLRPDWEAVFSRTLDYFRRTQRWTLSPPAL